MIRPNPEERRWQSAFERLAEMYLEFGVGRCETRREVIRVIREADQEALETMKRVLLKEDGHG
jgi:hypothetical protein